MKPRSFLIDITITQPNGRDAKNWNFVGHLFVDINESMMDMELLKMSSKVVQEIDRFLEKNPDAHNCMDEVSQEHDEYFCAQCGEEVTQEVQNLLTLSAERRLNARAADIVTVS